MNLEVLDGGSAFKVRAAALIVRDGRVLLNRMKSDETWMLPGGTGEFGETTQETLRRELREELGAEASVGRLLWVVEHFFGLTGRRWHQILWIHETSLPGDCAAARDDAFETPSAEGVDRFRWVPFDEMRRLRVLPGFLAASLRDLPREPRLLVHRDGA